jgi:hypothetical protein
MATLTQLSYGGTAAIVSGMGLIVGFDGATPSKVTLIGSLVLVALADNPLGRLTAAALVSGIAEVRSRQRDSSTGLTRRVRSCTGRGHTCGRNPANSAHSADEQPVAAGERRCQAGRRSQVNANVSPTRSGRGGPTGRRVQQQASPIDWARLPEQLRLLVRVCGESRLLELVVDLLEEFLGSLGVAVHVPFICMLSRADLVEGLQAQPLRGSEIGMMTCAHVLRGFLGERGPGQQSGSYGNQHGPSHWFLHGMRIVDCSGSRSPAVPGRGDGPILSPAAGLEHGPPSQRAQVPRQGVSLPDDWSALNWDAMRLELRALVLLGCVASAGLGVAVELQSAASVPPGAATRSLALKELQAREPDPARIAHALYCADRAFWAIRSSGVEIGGGAESATPESVTAGLAEKGITNRIDTGLEEACAALGLTVNELLSISLTAMRASPVAAAPRPPG